MKNIERIRALFLSGHVTEATNSEIVKITGIKPHQQVYQLTARLVESGFLAYAKRGREKVFFLARSQNDDQHDVVSAKDFTQPPDSSMYVNVHEMATVSDTSTTTDIGELLRVGFEEVGAWLLEGDTIKCQLPKHGESKKILYAFVSGDQVLYVGKSVRSLAQRLNGYRNPGPTQRTNTKVHRKIKDVLRQGKEVKILVFAPSEDEIIYRGIPLNLAAGLEDGLIARLQPPWNDTGKAR